MWARIIEGLVSDVSDVDPSTIYTPEVATTFIVVPDGAPDDLTPGYSYDGHTWTAPETVELPPPTVPFELIKSNKSDDVSSMRDAILYGGFSYDFGSPYGIKVLQTRPEDAINWLTLKSSCNDAIAAGQGNSVGVEIRTLDNVNVPLSFNAALQAMIGMTVWGSSVYSNSWRLKDAITASSNTSNLDLIDITVGWPAKPVVAPPATSNTTPSS